MKYLMIGLLTVLLAGCGGGSASDSAAPTNVSGAGNSGSATAAVIGFDNGEGASVGTVLSIKLSGAEASQVTKAYVDNTEVPFELLQDRILVATASLEAGARTVSLDVAGTKASKSLVLGQTLLPSEPKAYLKTALQGIGADLTAHIAAANAEERAYLLSLQAQLANQESTIAALDERTSREIAFALAANRIVPAATPVIADGGTRLLANSYFMSADQPYVFNEAACITSSRHLAAYSIGAAASIRLVVLSAHPLAKIAAAGSATGFIYLVGSTTEEVVLKCIVETPILNILDTSTRTALTGVQSFAHDVVRNYLLQVPGKLSNIVSEDTIAQVRGVGSLLEKARAAVSKLEIKMPSSFGARLASFGRDHVVPGQADRYEIRDVSDSRIEAQHAGTADLASMKFRFKDGQMPVDPADFSFSVYRRADGVRVATQSGRLAPGTVPVAKPMSLKASPGIALEGVLTGTNAARFEIVNAPKLGTVIMTDAQKGSFTYVVGETPTATDSFTFQAVNGNQRSQLATVTIDIDMYEAFRRAVVGSWSVTNLESGTVYQLTVNADGTGIYDAGGSRYNTRWEISKNEKGEYAFYEQGFWHYAFDTLQRDGLSLPVTRFQTYSYNYQTRKTDYSKLVQLYIKQ